MSSTNLVMTRVYLNPKQRAALERKAREQKAKTDIRELRARAERGEAI